MIDQGAVVTYAQYNEDIILLGLLYDVEKGFYVDVGANYPVIDSVTKLFYDRGWSGVNIEPIVKLHNQIVKKRPLDINLNCGVSDKPGTLKFHESVNKPGHSSFLKSEESLDDVFVERKVPVRTLSDILDEYAPSSTIHFMKIDVEGYEYEVIKGNDWNRFRPEVLCIESNHTKKNWRTILAAHGYKLFIADGLNEYYIAKESWHRTEGYAERVINIDYRTLKQHQYQSWAEDTRLLKHLTKLNHSKEDVIQNILNEMELTVSKVDEVKALSLKDVSYTQRVKRAVRGLTIDWLRYKRNKR